MNKSDNIADLANALAKCQGEMEPAIKDSVNPHFRSKFSSLHSVWEACRKPLSKNGLSVVQTMEMLNEKLHLRTTLMHLSGQWISSITPVISAKNDAQGIGSSLTYFKRYSLAALLGICTADEIDDDGEGAMNRNGQDSMPKNNGNKPKPEPVKETVTHQATCISQEQVKMISDAIEQCDESYISKLTKHLLDKGFPSYAHIPQDMFNQIMTGIGKNIELVEKRRKENGN